MYTETTLDFNLPIRRIVHCLVVTEPTRDAVVVEMPQNFSSTVRARRDQCFDETHFTVIEGAARVSLMGVEEILEACKEHTDVKRWTESVR